ncbi:MAG TPA: hypothetical protein VNY05_33660 [Candidatus Acidoferrales bacterium]|jgi:hypothetical protein|nr:hypothetical protein [Candidatus Acidoferrales bacterium]
MRFRQFAKEPGLFRARKQMQRSSALPFLFLLSLPGFQAALAQGPGPCFSTKAGTIACQFIDVASRTYAQAGTFPSIDTPIGNAVLVTPLASTQPVPSPASGFTYTFDPTNSVYVRSSTSFGPILAERADTIGSHKFFLGFAFQRFVFDKLDGSSTHSFQAPVPAPGGQFNENVNFDLQLNQTTVFMTYGISNRVDVSLAIPISTVYGSVVVNSVFVPTQTSGTPIRLFAEGEHTATGLGDFNLQWKATAIRKESAAVAVGTTLRLPTGDKYEALGAGTTGVKPFIAASVSYKKLSPHLDLAYQLNGKSILTGNIFTGVKRHLPDQFQYAAGVDAGVTRGLTLDFDILGAEVVHGDRLNQNFSQNPQLFIRKSYNMTNGAGGFKVNMGGNLLFVANLLFRLNDAGLRVKVAPLVGLSYGF